MIVDSKLAGRNAGERMSPACVSKLRFVRHEVNFPARIVGKLRAMIEARVPVGYEDETGFHYSLKASDWLFSI
jgi:hypothetical protein